MYEETKNWLEMAEYDLRTATHMMKAGRNIYVIFMCHLAIEKLLKAIVVERKDWQNSTKNARPHHFI